MDLRPRKKPKHQDASLSEASSGYVDSPKTPWMLLTHSLDSNRTTTFSLLHRRPSPTNANTVRRLKPPLQPIRPRLPIFIRLRINERDSLPKRVQNPALPGTTSAVVHSIRNPFLVKPLVPPECPSLGTLTALGSSLIT
jgi:hypothetical protein